MRYTRRSLIKAPLEQVFRHCTSRAGFCQHFPFRVDWRSGPEQWQLGDTLDFRYRVFGIWFVHRADILEFEPNQIFVDQMIEGIYRYFRHTHRFEPAPGGTYVIDEVEFSLGTGKLLDRIFGLPTLDHAFRRRHRALASYWEK